jgi:hypothetical protein
MLTLRPAYCTQQTGGPRRGIILRAIQASDADRPAKRGAVRPNPTKQHCVQYCYRAVLRGWAFRPYLVTSLWRRGSAMVLACGVDDGHGAIRQGFGGGREGRGAGRRRCRSRRRWRRGLCASLAGMELIQPVQDGVELLLDAVELRGRRMPRSRKRSGRNRRCRGAQLLALTRHAAGRR